ncbi:DUF484 family protein [Zophobihabitans entericus]|uniref:DUF484 family protein n=1 Tax=Zophobihabitans entericus TaxID=1635327 RepID=UPI00389A5F44
MTKKRRAKAKPRVRKVKLNDELVNQYLTQNPDFFIRNARQVETMRIPHPVRGVVSLPEWQLARQRNKIKELEQEVTLLMEHASANEYLFEHLMTLQKELLQAENLGELVTRLNRWAKSLGLLGGYVYLFEDKWALSAPSSFHHLSLSSDKFNFIRVRHLQYSYHYLGQLNPTELTLLVPNQEYVGSVALSLLGEFGDLGVLVFASRDHRHYQSGQGTLLLEKISEILPILIKRWVTRKK